jgi:hypothetical protein
MFQHLEVDTDDGIRRTMCGKLVVGLSTFEAVPADGTDNLAFDPKNERCVDCQKERARLFAAVAADRIARPAQYGPLPKRNY